MIKYEDFAKLELKVARVVSAERVEGADKILKLRINLGNEERTIAAGIAKYYAPEELVGKKIIVLANLEPKEVRGIQSNGMLLAASTKNYERLAVLTVDKEVPEGSKVS